MAIMRFGTIFILTNDFIKHTSVHYKLSDKQISLMCMLIGPLMVSNYTNVIFIHMMMTKG